MSLEVFAGGVILIDNAPLSVRAKIVGQADDFALIRIGVDRVLQRLPCADPYVYIRQVIREVQLAVIWLLYQGDRIAFVVGEYALYAAVITLSVCKRVRIILCGYV